MCDPLVLVLPTGQMCIDDLANGGRHHYQSTKASTGLLIIIHTSSPQLSLSPSPIWSACPITNHSDLHQNFSQCSQLFQVCFSLRECPLLLISLALVIFSGPKLFRSLPTNVPQIYFTDANKSLSSLLYKSNPFRSPAANPPSTHNLSCWTYTNCGATDFPHPHIHVLHREIVEYFKWCLSSNEKSFLASWYISQLNP